MWKNILFLICVLFYSGSCDDGEVKDPKEKCDIKDEIKSLKQLITDIISTNNEYTDYPKTIDDKMTMLPYGKDVATLNKILERQKQQIALLKLLISQQNEGVTLINSSIAEKGGILKESANNLSTIINVIARKIGAFDGYKEENLMFSDRTSEVNFPFLGLLGYGSSLKDVEWRGDVGIIISNRHILTTAWRATEPYNGGLSFVAFGVTDRTGSRQDWQVHRFQKITVHPGYKRYGYQDDVAVLETEKPIKFSDRVKAACLPTGGEKDEEVSLATWWNGLLNRSGDFVRSVKVQSYTDAECIAKYGNYNVTTQVCYGDKEDLRSSSNSWSGDPLVTAEKDGCATVTGIRWFGGVNLPDVYTMLIHYVPWIYATVKAH